MKEIKTGVYFLPSYKGNHSVAMFALRKKSFFASMTKNMKEIYIIFDLQVVRNKYCLLQVKIKTLHYLLSNES